jgi:competence protein ComEC
MVAGLDGAQGHVIGPGPWVLPLIALGALWLILWQGRARFAGLALVAVGFVLWTMAERPPILVADTGGLVGVMTPDGRALSKPRGAGFVASVWLENDGDGSDQETAAARWPGDPGRLRHMRVGAIELVHVIGKRAAANLDECREDQIVIASVPLTLAGPCQVYDLPRLRRTGALAIGPKSAVTAQQRAGARLWNISRDRRRRSDQ